jgi:hypothetical protein
MAPVAGGQRPAIGLRLLSRAFLTWRASPSPLPPHPSLPYISLRLFELMRGTQRALTASHVGVAGRVGRAAHGIRAGRMHGTKQRTENREQPRGHPGASSTISEFPSKKLLGQLYGRIYLTRDYFL